MASFLRDRSELWVARRFASSAQYHPVFRSCNRAFAQDPARRSSAWCRECDKCLFVELVLAPFVDARRCANLGGEPLADPAREAQLRTLVGLGEQHKPFECVGDPDESAVALAQVSESRSGATCRASARRALGRPDADVERTSTPQGPTRVPAHWLR